MEYCNSIYRTLRFIAGTSDTRKLATAYVHALLKGRERGILSKDPIIDEAQNVYVGLDTMGRYTLDNHPSVYEAAIKNKLNENNNHAFKGTVEEIVLDIFNRKGFDNALKQIGSKLSDVLKQKPDLEKPLEDINAGFIQRYEQKAILKKLSETD